MTYPAKHRAPSRRTPIIAAVAAALVLVTATPAAAATPHSGEGWISLVARTCGSSKGWQTIAKANGSHGPSWILPLRSVVVNCPGRASGGGSKGPAKPAKGWVSPLVHYRLTSCRGMRWGSLHQGIDMAAPTGTPIRAASAGTITGAGWLWRGYGIQVIVKHSGGVWTHYSHMTREVVSPGQKVKAGQVIGYVGQTGFATGPHLDFEISRTAGYGGQFDPASWLRRHGVSIGC